MNCAAGRTPRHDLAIRRGDSAAVILRFRTLSQTGVTRILDLSESAVTLDIDWPGGGLMRRSDDGGLAVEGLAGTVTWQPTPEETMRIPDGRIATYRLVREVEDGERRTLVAGFLVGIGLISEEGGHSDD
ncbi:hypothetical protein ACUSIJ_03495 [Pseudochelatococcus sp. B33]